MRQLILFAFTGLLAAGCAAPVVKSQRALSQSVAPGMELLRSLHERAVRANAQDLLLQWPADWALSEAERSGFVRLACAPHSAVSAALSAPLATVVAGQRALEAIGKAGDDFDLVLGYVRTPKTAGAVASTQGIDCSTDVSARLARQLVSADALPAAAAAAAQQRSTLARMGSAMPKLLGLGDEVGRARALQAYVGEHRGEIENALAAMATPEMPGGVSLAGSLVEQLRDHHLRQALAGYMELRRNAAAPLAQRASVAERAVRHLGEYDTLLEVRMDGEGGVMPLLQSLTRRYLNNIETGETTPLDGLGSLLDTAKRVRGLGVLPF